MDAGKLYPVTWFKPGEIREDLGVPGTYHVDEEGRVEAHTHRLFDDQPPPLFGAGRGVPQMLVGRSGSNAVTLVGARAVSGSGWNMEWDTCLRANYSLEGYLLLEEEDLYFTDVRFRFADQDVWTGWERFDVQTRHDLTVEGLAATLQDVPVAEARVPGGTLRLVDASYAHEDHAARRWTLQSRSEFELHFDEPVAIGEIFDRYAYPLQVMLMAASGRLPGMVSMAGTNAEWEIPEDGVPIPTRWFTVRHFHGPIEEARSSDIRYLFRLQDLDFSRHLPALIEAVDKHRFALGHYAVLCSEGFVGGLPVQFGMATQLIDAFDRTLHPGDVGDPAFEARLKRLEDECGNVVDAILKTRGWRGQVGRLRNTVVHGDRFAHELLRDQRPLVVAYHALMVLFEVRFLVAIGLDAATAGSLTTRAVRHWMKEKDLTENYPALVEFDKRQQDRRPAKRSSR